MTTNELRTILHDAEDSLTNAVGQLKIALRAAKQLDMPGLAAEIDGYALSNLRAFLNDRQQPGSFPSLFAAVDSLDLEED